MKLNMRKISYKNLILLPVTISFFSLSTVYALTVNPNKIQSIKEPELVFSPTKTEKNIKNIEMVFVLDTTGSMGGLIEGAKTKIWRIVNTVMQSTEKVNFKMGLVAYRDKGDSYITEVTPLSDDLDRVYGKLMAYRVDGGGDEPEDVRSAMRDALNKVGWSDAAPCNHLHVIPPTCSKTTQILFLVGDAPPHDDYQQINSAQETAQTAWARGIRVNTIQVGNISATTKIWQEIAKSGGGEYFAIAQNGGVKAIATPYDKELSDLGDKVNSDALYYGQKNDQLKLQEEGKQFGSSLAGASTVARADRAANKSINYRAYNSRDLIQAIENQEINLSTIKKDELPEIMQNNTLSENKKYIDERILKRKVLREKIAELSKKRDLFLKENEKNTDGFDAVVFKALEKQIK